MRAWLSGWVCVCAVGICSRVCVHVFLLWMQEVGWGGYVHKWGRGLGVSVCVRVSVCAGDKDLAKPAGLSWQVTRVVLNGDFVIPTVRKKPAYQGTCEKRERGLFFLWWRRREKAVKASGGLKDPANQTAPPSSALIFIQNAEMLNHSNRIDPCVSACVAFSFSLFPPCPQLWHISQARTERLQRVLIQRQPNG